MTKARSTIGRIAFALLLFVTACESMCNPHADEDRKARENAKGLGEAVKGK